MASLKQAKKLPLKTVHFHNTISSSVVLGVEFYVLRAAF